MCRDSNTSDWIYIIKNGSCRVLKSLKVPTRVPFKTRLAASNAQSMIIHLEALYDISM
jgi:hypothetical protein